MKYRKKPTVVEAVLQKIRFGLIHLGIYGLLHLKVI